jgi:hypothetical protein
LNKRHSTTPAPEQFGWEVRIRRAEKLAINDRQRLDGWRDDGEESSESVRSYYL